MLFVHFVSLKLQLFKITEHSRPSPRTNVRVLGAGDSLEQIISVRSTVHIPPRRWVRSKNEQLKKERLLKRSNAAVSRQLARQSKKSKNLAKALETAQIYRYTDWYGYRF